MKQLRSVLLASTIVGLSILSTHAITIHENFTSDPANRGWRIAGDTNLFGWNSTNQTLEVTWDSARPNSYFYRPIGTTLNRTQDFQLSFQINLKDVGYYVEKPNGFQIAIGLINFNQATNSSFLRGTGFNSPNVFEFDYFPPSIYDATVAPTAISSSHEFASSFNFPYELPTNTLVKVVMTFTASSQTLATTVHQNDQALGPVQNLVLGTTNFSDFHVDTVAVCSYSDAGQYPGWEGSVLAHGNLSELSLIVPGIPIGAIHGTLTNNAWQTSFDADPNWTYTLQRTENFITWTNLSSTNVSMAKPVILTDVVGSKGFYRVLAEKLIP